MTCTDKIGSKIFALSAQFSISGLDLIKSAIQLTSIGLACAHPAHSSNDSVVYVQGKAQLLTLKPRPQAPPPKERPGTHCCTCQVFRGFVKYKYPSSHFML